MDYITNIDIFNRSNLIGDQSITTINSFNDYLDSLLNPFNDILTQLLLESEDISIQSPITYTTFIISNLQIKHNNLLNKYSLIDNISTITTNSNTFIGELNTVKSTFTAILNNKALSITPLTRPTLTTVLTTNNNNAVNKQYIVNTLLDYSLPTPIPNTKLYVNRDGNGYIWA